MTQYTDEQLEEAMRTGAVTSAMTPALVRYKAKLRKRNSRASAEQRIELPLPAGTAAALRRVCEAAGDEPVALLATVVHRLDHIMLTDPATFEFLTRPPRADVTAVAARYADRIGAPAPEDEK